MIDSNQIYLSFQNQPSGPHNPSQIQEMISQGKVNDQTPACFFGSSEWSPLGKFLPQFFTIPTGTFQPPPAPVQPNPFNELENKFASFTQQNLSTALSIYANRFWLTAGMLVTLLMPVLVNRNTKSLGWNGNSDLNGWETCVPSTSFYNMSSMVITSHNWSPNPVAIILYLGLIKLCWNYFSGLRPTYERMVSRLIFSMTIALPLTHILFASLFIPNFTSVWHVQGINFGWWILFLGSFALMFSIEGNNMREKSIADLPQLPKF